MSEVKIKDETEVGPLQAFMEEMDALVAKHGVFVLVSALKENKMTAGILGFGSPEHILALVDLMAKGASQTIKQDREAFLRDRAKNIPALLDAIKAGKVDDMFDSIKEGPTH